MRSEALLGTDAWRRLNIFMEIKGRVFYVYATLISQYYIQRHTQGNNKNNEGKQHRKNTNGNVQSVTT
jgi:hypothetical protein